MNCQGAPPCVFGNLAISAETEDEVIEAAARHAEEVHGFEDTPEFRDQLRAAVKEGSPRS